MIRVVVRNQQDLPENGLSRSMRNRRNEVGLRVGGQGPDCGKILEERLDRSIPCRLVRRSLRLRPVLVGPGRCDMIRV